MHMNTCYYYQDLLPRPVHVLATARFNPIEVSNLLVYSMIAPAFARDTRFIRDSVRYGYTD